MIAKSAMRETTRRPKGLGRLGRVAYACERESRNIDTKRDRVRKTVGAKPTTDQQRLASEVDRPEISIH
ncbi:hypothetical protein E2C01_078151 [Portunus trituberculatus]|uniref:Uncharacterized protein n=1 Tax=Portunus trituberculatus TaxID=210409 RepID=A0A5B7ID80_PORTR|nr:hypothetical protein [Portunus trituberculatus]